MPTIEEVASLVGPAYGEWLRGQLKARNMTQRQFAQRSGVEHSTISRIVSGSRNPSLKTARKIVEALQGRFDREVRAAGSSIATARVEYALRSDELLNEDHVTLLMRAYLAVRARAAAEIEAGPRPRPRLERSSTQRARKPRTDSRPE